MSEISEEKEVTEEISAEQAQDVVEVQEESSVEDAAAEEVAAEEAQEAPAEEPVEEIAPDVYAEAVAEAQKSILAHFNALRNLIKVTKDKDDSIFKLSGQIDKYRESFTTQLFKTVANALIIYREDCRKSLREVEKFDLTQEKAAKYLKYLTMDWEEMMENLGLEEDDEWKYNGKKLNAPVPARRAFFAEELPLSEAEIALPETVIGAEGLAAYLAACEDAMRKLLAEESVHNRTLGEYVKYASAIEEGYAQSVLYPVLRKLVSVSERMNAEVKEEIASLTEENFAQVYAQRLVAMIDTTEEILLGCGVTIDGMYDDEYDVKKHRLLKLIPVTEEEADKNRKVAFRYTECYIMNEKVIYPAKVDVYKLN